MDVVQAVSGYISKMVSAGDSASGTTAVKMKILLLDQDTVSIVRTMNSPKWKNVTFQVYSFLSSPYLFMQPLMRLLSRFSTYPPPETISSRRVWQK